MTTTSPEESAGYATLEKTIHEDVLSQLRCKGKGIEGSWEDYREEWAKSEEQCEKEGAFLTQHWERGASKAPDMPRETESDAKRRYDKQRSDLLRVRLDALRALNEAALRAMEGSSCGLMGCRPGCPHMEQE